MPHLRCVRALAVLIAALALCSCASVPLCSYLVLRLDDPLEVSYAGLDPHEPDLVAIDVVTGVVPRCFLRRQLAVPHGWENASTVVRTDGSLALAEPMVLRLYKGEAEWRERLFQRRRIERWDADRRADEKLSLAADLAVEQRRSFRIAVATTDAGARTFELLARSGEEAERMIATIRVPADLTPPELSFGTKALVLPPLVVLDAAMVAGGIVVAPFVLPLMWIKSGPEPVDDSSAHINTWW